ncbi:DUF58 domain-containing protein [Pseudoalteromonas denitrificans]|uniref:DUF58 domain-containing protein n=1 Tax=Pseudoalteromonas denitrificans DSM 6059 TaxID=1123010 RepID=A0A1I1T1N3_9GAMM|nr:DUF58 domain-containing protein [Pseudoalteromonas denitrificans]SFD52587.1 Protein of unknown function DUF58 [Pseudoalteromonas denitrificans DSM 6059]
MTNTTEHLQWLKSCHANGVSLDLKELIYYRAKARLLDLTPKNKIKHKMAGQYLAPHKGRGMEFAEVRHYQPGDDIRSIDWRVTARTGQTHTKIYQEEKERPVFIFTDFSNTMLFGSQLLLKSVQAAHLSALVAWSASERGDRVGGLVFNQNQHLELKPSARGKAVLKLTHNLISNHQEALSIHGADTAQNANCFSENLKRLNQLAKPGSLIYLISDFCHLGSDQKNNEALKQLQMLSRHCELVACQISDPFETHLPEHNSIIKVDTGSSESSLPLMNKSFRKRFNDQAQAQLSNRITMLKKSGLHLFSFSSSSPIEQQIIGKA